MYSLLKINITTIQIYNTIAKQSKHTIISFTHLLCETDYKFQSKIHSMI